jgi:uncharacterized protein YndB with AHSA1/START domain
MPDIMHLLKIKTSPERVYQELTTAEGIRHWWTRDAILDTKIGGTGEFGFYDHRFVISVNVQELKPAARVAWKITSSGQPAFADTTVSFDLRADGHDTLLAFAHRGFKQADDGYAGATTRWGYYLVSLKQYLEAGKGSPNPDDVDV